MRVLVTGSTSLIGRSTVASLLVRGDTVTVFQRESSRVGDNIGLEESPHTTSEVLGDVCSASDVARAIRGQDAVIHLAAKVGATGSWSDYEQVNVVGTQNMVEAAKYAGVRRFVQVSSPSVAHAGEALIGAEAGVADPSTTRGHYSTSKAMAEVLALQASSTAMSVVAIRPHLIWGPGDTQLVERIVERTRSGRLALVGTGAALIDSTYIDNAASALVAALNRADQLAGRALVVSNGEPRTVAELFGRIAQAAGVTSPVRHVPRKAAFAGGLLAERVWERSGRQDDPPMTGFLAEQLSTAHWFDQRETRAALDWAPTVSLDQGFGRLTQWFEAQDLA